MQRILTCFAIIGALSGCAKQPADFEAHTGVVYEIHSGINYESAGWYKAECIEKFQKLEVESYDLYVCDKDSEGNQVIKRERSTPSGDWFYLLDYTYDARGRLVKIDFEFRTFNGYDEKSEEFISTTCIRTYSVSAAGVITKVSESIKDSNSGEEVRRSFFEPEIDHWMTLEEVPKPKDR